MDRPSIHDACLILLASAEEDVDKFRDRARRLKNLLPPPHRLRLLARFIDGLYPNDKVPEVQNDLRMWADTIETVLVEEAE